MCSRLLHKLWFGKPHVFSRRPVPFCNFFHRLVNTLNQLAKAKVLHPSGLRSAFRLIRSLTKVCADALFLGESGVGQRMTSPLAVTTQWVWVGALVMGSVVSGHVSGRITGRYL